MDNSASISALREELARLSLVSDNIRRTIKNLEDQNQVPDPVKATTRRATDRDGRLVYIGDRVTFLTKRRLKSKEGIVSRFSRNEERVFAIDHSGNEIPRAPHNLRVNHVE